ELLSRKGSQERGPPPRPVLPPARSADPRARAARTAGGYPAAGEPFPGLLLDPPPGSQTAGAEIDEAGVVRAAGAGLAGQRTRAPERHRARGGPPPAGRQRGAGEYSVHQRPRPT